MRALLVLDPMLDPVQRGLFLRGTGAEEAPRGDEPPLYSAPAAIAASSILLEVLFGHGGVLANKVPDASLLWALRYLVFCQHIVLLPAWAVAVFRWYQLRLSSPDGMGPCPTTQRTAALAQRTQTPWSPDGGA